MSDSLFKYLIAVEPLGFLHGSAGRFLSPDNLVGRAGSSFPPSAATLSGLFAATYGKDETQFESWHFAGPFWGEVNSVTDSKKQTFYVPIPFNCLVRKGENSVCDVLDWQEEKWIDREGKAPTGKFESGMWVAIDDWDRLTAKNAENLPKIKKDAWEFIPHLHPQLEESQRRVRIEIEDDTVKGGLFLENAVQLNPECCLVYLSSHELLDGWYRFGGEGHLADVRCLPLNETNRKLLTKDLGQSFATITPAVWGSNRLSTRYPLAWEDKLLTWITERPHLFRHRLGGNEKTKRLSRGRYAVPAGTVYLLKEPLPPYQKWSEDWFPREGPSFKRWGCGLALPLNMESTDE